MEARKNNVANKTVYVDVMKDGRFYCQIPYTYCPLWPIDVEKLAAYIVEKRPSLAGKEVSLAFSNAKVF